MELTYSYRSRLKAEESLSLYTDIHIGRLLTNRPTKWHGE